MIPNEPVLSSNQTWRTLIPATEKHFYACREDALSFPQVRGVVESSEYIVNVDCACCGSENHAPLFIKWGFTHSECASCKHIFIQNQLRPEILLSFYETSIADNLSLERQENPHQKNYWMKVYEKYLSGLAPGLDKNNCTLLDVGCGIGTFLRYAKTISEFTVYGSEFSESAKEPLKTLLGKTIFIRSILAK